MDTEPTDQHTAGNDMADVTANREKFKASRPSMPWFRMYAEFATDPKVQMLSEADQRRFMMLLCLRCSNGGVTLQDAECAFQLRITDAEYAETKAVLVARGLIDEDNQPTAWDRRQYLSDTSKQRVSRHRARKKDAAKRDCNVTVTPPDTDTDTDTDTESEKKKSPVTASLDTAARNRLAGLNGSADFIFSDFVDWGVEPSDAVELIAAHCERYGAEATKDAHLTVKSEIAEGKPVKAPLALMRTICERKKGSRSVGMTVTERMVRAIREASLEAAE